MTAIVNDDHRRALAADGAICLRQAFGEADMRLVDDAFGWTLDHPSPGAAKRYTDEPGTFYESTNYSPGEPAFRRIFEDTPALDIVRALYGHPRVFYLGEQLFMKYGGHARRTPWHQDLSYLPFSGESVLGLWISLGDLPKTACLEFVRGSHRDVLYNGASYLDPADDTHPLYPDASMPRLPDIEADRAAWDILSWDLQRGDLIAFHLGALHGGGGTTPGLERRSLTVRFIGEEAVWTAPLPKPDPEAFSERRAKANRATAARPALKSPPVPGTPMFESGQFVEL